ncbi:MAG: hypothetical protein R3E32_15210 [Chitinophagales bacterium]
MKTIQKNLVWTLLVLVTLFTANTQIFAQSCSNTLRNASADNGTNGWDSYGSTAIANLAGGNKSFKVISSDSHFYQDVNIPSGSKFVHFSGYTRNSQNNAPTGHAYLYGYIMDANDRILEYVQFGVNNTGMSWELDEQTVKLTSSAKKVRFFLKKSSKNGVADTGNMAHFDNLALSFNCKKTLPEPGTDTCSNALRNPSADQDTNGWMSYGTTNIANLAGGNKAFQVQQSDSHFYQDVAIPRGSSTAYISGYTRNSQNNAPTGHAYLYAYIMDSNDRILEYVQFGVTHTSMIWTLEKEKVALGSNAVKVRLFIKKSSKNGVADTGNMAYGDNLSVSFDCKNVLGQPKQY